MTNPNVLRILMAEEKTIIAPMIEVFGNKSGYSNYWGGLDDDGYYKRTDDYFPVLNRETTGCFDFPMIHSTYLIDLRRNITNKLVYYPPPDSYRGEIDDVLIFAYSARSS
ncbi:procollagen galactosyltransferase 1-A-like, partial [Exaiptasia diaphana]|uniref:Uncharacterized protein n=1 Tax=Exaiptasia diaphana TaxID=2652724 RepID=A0A913XLC8_EXADI